MHRSPVAMRITLALAVSALITIGGTPAEAIPVAAVHTVVVDPPTDAPVDPVPAPTDSLDPGAELQRGDALLSADGRTEFVLQTDGNAVVYVDSVARWASWTVGRGEVLRMQPDGNLVLYSSSGVASWTSGSWGNPGAHLAVQNDGNAVVYRPDGSAAWSSGTSRPPAVVVTDTLRDATLRSGEQLTSSDGRFRAVMQGDGNFVVYGPTGAIWTAGTSGAGNRLAMQSDGNAVVYPPNGPARWQSGTGGHPGARMVMQNDGNLVIYGTGEDVLWASIRPAPPAQPAPLGDTLSADQRLSAGQQLVSTSGAYRAAMQGDGNFVVYGSSGVRWSAGTSGVGNRLEMQGDGNAVIYGSSGARWQSGTGGNPGARMVMQNDGNLVIYSAGGRPLWSSVAPPPVVAPPGGGGVPSNPADVDCDDFATWAAANAWFQAHQPGDPAGLDDGDGIPCESLPGAP